MTDILNFPGHPKSEGRHEFISEGSETLQFGDGGDAKIVAPAAGVSRLFASHSQPRARYWSNQELADLYRVKRLLDAAGIVCEVDHGSTDEDDPWFVFCDETGDVFIHLCRIDGEYLLDSQSLSSPLRGENFNGLIEAFTRRHIPEEAQPSVSTGSSSRVVRFRQNGNGNVFMHPATMLAALVWTLLLNSEKLVMLLPDAAEEYAGTVDDLGSAPVTADGHSDVISDDAAGDDHLDQSAAADGLHIDLSGDHPAEQLLRELAEHGDTKLNYNTYAVGLSAIAIAAGFMSTTTIVDINPLGLSDILAALIGAEQTATSGEQHAALSGLDENTIDFLVFVESILEELELFGAEIKAAENAVETAGEETDGDSQTFQAHLLESLPENTGQELVVEADWEDAVEGTISTETAKIDHGFLQALAEAQEEPSDDANAVEFVLASLDLSEDNVLDNLQTMVVENREIRATFDVTEAVLDKTDSLLTGALSDPDIPLTDSQTIEFSVSRDDGRQHYDEHAQAIVQFIMDNSEDLEIIATQDEVMFFDAAIIDADVDDIIVFAWTLDNGDTIAAMGLRSELEDAHFIM